MAQTHSHAIHQTIHSTPAIIDERKLSIQAYQILHVAFAIAPIVAGADKFFNILVNWEQYLAPIAPRITGLTPNQFMGGIGIVEMVAGIGVILKPKIFGYVVAAWLAGIIVNLLVLGNYYDVAVRDLGLCLGALALGRLAQAYEKKLFEGI